MPNQMIALQSRGANIPDPTAQTAKFVNMMNMAKQQEAAQRQASLAQQTMDINQAQESRAAALHNPALAKAGYEADTAQIKMMSDFSKLSVEGLKQAQNSEDAIKIGDYIKSKFKDPQLQGLVDQTVAKLTANPANFEAARRQVLFQSMETDKQLDQTIANLTTGAETYQVASPKYAGAPGGMKATEVPGTRVQAPQGITYVRGADGAVYPMPSKSGGGFDTPAPAVGVPPTAGAPGRGNTADVVYGFGEFGSPSKPLSTLSIGEVQDFQRNTLIPKTRGQIGKGPRIGTGAVGTYQITYGTLQDYAPKVLGANWRNATFTADVQEQIAKAIYEDVKGENLKDTWAGLPSNRPGQYANVPWEQVRDQIIQVESAGGPRRGAGTGVSAAAPGGPVAIIPGKPPAPKAGEVTPEKQKARSIAMQNLYDAIVDAQKKGHLLSEANSFVANRAQELRRDRAYTPGGTAQKTSLDNIEANAAQLMRQFIEKGTSGTLNAVAEQKLFLRGVGAADSTYETRLRTIRNLADQYGITLNEGGAAKPKAEAVKPATPTTKAPPGVPPEDWKYMSPAERKLWVK